MAWQVPKVWAGSEVWILGGGPSIMEEFDVPPDLVKRVISRELTPAAYSPYLEKIHSKHVIGINIAYLIGSWIDIVFFGDSNFYTKHHQGLSNFLGIKATCHPQLDNVPWIKFVPMDMSKPFGIASKRDHVSWNNNSGAAAISLAAHLGAKRIILLGFDMKIGENNMQHWHDLYNKGPLRQDDPTRVSKLPFKKHMIGFAAIARDAKERGIEIINASPNSAITELRKCSVKDLL